MPLMPQFYAGHLGGGSYFRPHVPSTSFLGALTPWRVSATRADVHVHHGSLIRAGHSRSWLSWFCFDGGDTTNALRSFCEAAGLNAILRDLCIHTDVLDFDGPRRPVRFCLTGDGKVMQSGHHGTGLQCWLCDEAVTSIAGLVPNPSFATHLTAFPLHTGWGTMCIVGAA